jgi:hypothetical protein
MKPLQRGHVAVLAGVTHGPESSSL